MELIKIWVCLLSEYISRQRNQRHKNWLPAIDEAIRDPGERSKHRFSQDISDEETTSVTPMGGVSCPVPASCYQPPRTVIA